MVAATHGETAVAAARPPDSRSGGARPEGGIEEEGGGSSGSPCGGEGPDDAGPIGAAGAPDEE